MRARGKAEMAVVSGGGVMAGGARTLHLPYCHPCWVSIAPGMVHSQGSQAPPMLVGQAGRVQATKTVSGQLREAVRSLETIHCRYGRAWVHGRYGVSATLITLSGPEKSG